MLKGNSLEVNKNISIFSKIESPYEILKEETPKGKFISKYSNKINKIYHNLLEKSLKDVTENKILLFIYPDSKISFTSDLANELIHRYPKKIIAVSRIKDEMIRISLRTSLNNVELPGVINKIFNEMKGGGGGHEHAAAVEIHKDDFEKFIKLLRKYV